MVHPDPFCASEERIVISPSPFRGKLIQTLASAVWVCCVFVYFRAEKAPLHGEEALECSEMGHNGVGSII